MKKIREKIMCAWISATVKDPGESHVITVIAMCVIGVALVLLLSTTLRPVITTMCGTMEDRIASMFNGL